MELNVTFSRNLLFTALCLSLVSMSLYRIIAKTLQEKNKH
jgi:hypothetical protein